MVCVSLFCSMHTGVIWVKHTLPFFTCFYSNKWHMGSWHGPGVVVQRQTPELKQRKSFWQVHASSAELPHLQAMRSSESRPNYALYLHEAKDFFSSGECGLWQSVKESLESLHHAQTGPDTLQSSLLKSHSCEAKGAPGLLRNKWIARIQI